MIENYMSFTWTQFMIARLCGWPTKKAIACTEQPCLKLRLIQLTMTQYVEQFYSEKIK